MMSQAKKRTCQRCKIRKVRCDKQEPSCKRCLRSNQQCTYTKGRQSISFRHSRFSTLVAAINSINDTSHQGSQIEYPEDDELSIQQTSPLDLSPIAPSTQSPAQARYSVSSPNTVDCRVQETAYELSPNENTTTNAPSTTRILLSDSPWEHVALSATSTGQNRCTRDKVPLLALIEGELLHFYIENVGPWLDVTSPERHYTYTVPRLARQYRVLHTAIMACSAHILRLLDKSKVELADTEENYQSECVALLIPFLSDVESAVQDETIAATIAILRMSEQYDEYHVDRQCHLVPGAFAYLGPSIPSSTSLGGLLQATFYSYVRADIRMAILGQCGTKLSVKSWPFDESSPSTDADWTNRITWLLVHAANLCYSNNTHGVMSYPQLKILIAEWKANLPPTFEPYFYSSNERDPFPVIRLLCPWHIVGLQFYHTSEILLATHYPPREIFNNAFHAHKYLETKILFHVRMLCAISFSNEHFGCRINASHLVAMGSCFFTGRQEQWCVRDYFNMLQNQRAWPSRACQEMLDSAWGEKGI